MKYYACTEAPIEISGLDVIDPSNKRFWRMRDEEAALVSDAVRDRSKTPCGGRIRFRTNAISIWVRLYLHTLAMDLCIPLAGSAGLDVYTGTGINSMYRGYVSPLQYGEENKVQEKEIWLQTETKTMVQVTLNLPRNEQIAGVEIGIPEYAEILPPLPFASEEKILYYGSSITEGGCASRPGNAYTAMVARWLDCDYQNLGFSGIARGEEAMAEWIAKKDCTIFVMDYDHNAPDALHLEATHETFYKIIRNARPELPIIMMSKPDFERDPVGNAKRRDVIMRTYNNARVAGDENIYFLNGETFFGSFGRDSCTIDGCHPTDLGFYRMAEQVYHVIQSILHKKNG